MNNLKELGINNNTIERIIKNNSESIIFTIENNIENITEIINYMKQIGIYNIDELLVYEIDYFLLNINTLKNKITNQEIIDNINNDCTYIEKI